MNKELRKSFSELKNKCKTKSQRFAFNKLIKSFAIPHSIKECLDKSSLKIENIVDHFNLTGDPADKGHYEITVDGKNVYLTPGPDIYLINAYKINEDGLDLSSKINSKLITATKFDKQLSEFIKMI